MKEQAYLDLHRLEQEHWWYRGTRAVYQALLQRYAAPFVSSQRAGKNILRRAQDALSDRSSSRLVLDLGCGSGGNTKLLSRWGTVVGLDAWRPALRSCDAKMSSLVQGVAEALPFCEQTFDLVAVLGVLEHVADDVAMLRQVRRVCRPGARVLVLTSAFTYLWSQHDEANRHARRYTARELRLRAQRAGLRVRYLSYQNVALYPLAVVVRMLQRLRRPAAEPRIDMFPMPEPISTALAGLLALEGQLMRWTAFPIGVSLVAVLER